MTAIKKYTRLESSGLWKESRDTEFIEVLISLGKTSVVLSDYKDNPLTHWSLGAIKLISQDQQETIFSTNFDDGERLCISDVHMINALLLFIQKDDKKSIKRETYLKIFWIVLILFLSISGLYFPSKFRELSSSIISRPHEQQLIEPFLQNYIESAGGICNSEETKKIMRKVLNLVEKHNNPLSVLIIRNQKINTLHLPSGIILISSEFLEEAPSSRQLIKMLKGELPRAINRQPLKTLVEQQSTLTLVKFALGFEPKLPVITITDFIRPSYDETNAQENQLDDFSWVALQNACLN